MKKTKGFTLVELMVVVALVGVLAAIALPSFLQSIRANTVKSKADELAAFLRYARTESVTKKKTMTVFLNDKNWEIKVGDTVERTLSLSEVAYSKSSKDNQFFFMGTGGSSSNIDFLLCKDDDVTSAIYISVEKTGVINLYEAGKNKLGSPINSCQF